MKDCQLKYRFCCLIAILCFNSLFALSICGQNFVQYSNNEIEETELYIKGNIYQKDFLLFIDILQKCHPAFATEYTPPFDIATVAQEGYQRANKCKSIKELWCQMQQIATLLNDGHTLMMPEIDMNLIYPFVVIYDNNSFYVKGINEEYKFCLGKQISRFNGYSLDDVLSCFKKIISHDNEAYFLNKFMSLIQLYSIWNYTSCCSPDSILRIEFADGTNVSMPPMSKVKINMAMQKTQEKSRTIRQNFKVPFLYTLVKEKKICYLQFNSCIDQNSVRTQYLARNPSMSPVKLEELLSKYPRFDTFLNEMFEEIQRDSISTLVVDVRNNSGGDSSLCDILLSHLKSRIETKQIHTYIRISELWKLHYPVLATEYEKVFNNSDQPLEMGKLYDINVIASRLYNQQKENSLLYNKSTSVFDGDVIFIQNALTYSSAGLLVTLAQDNNIGITIGENSSYRPCSFGDILAWQLPNTKLKGYVSHKYFIRPNKNRCNEDYLSPNVRLYPNLTDVLKDKDVCWEWILEKFGPNN